MKKTIKKLFAFTLAEVLITLGIIGIVAEMTIPTLINDFQAKATVTSVRELYSIFNQAYLSAVKENGSPEGWDLVAAGDGGGAVNMLAKLSPHLKLIKDCGNAADSGCFPDVTYKYLRGTDWGNLDDETAAAKAILSNGVSFRIRILNKDCAENRGSSLLLQNICAHITVDINGFKSPNQMGRDVFMYYITKFGVVPAGTVPETEAVDKYTFANNCAIRTTQGGMGCAAWVMYNENMDYLKCSTLSWSGAHTCP